MTYKRDKTYKLVFEDDEFAGLEIRVRSVPIGDYFRLISIPGRLDAMTREEALKEDEWAQGLFCERLIGWNLTGPDPGNPDGEGLPTPATYEGLRSHDLEFVAAVISAWIDAMAGVPAPLPGGSSSGGTSLEPSIPMEPLSPVPPS